MSQKLKSKKFPHIWYVIHHKSPYNLRFGPGKVLEKSLVLIHQNLWEPCIQHPVRPTISVLELGPCKSCLPGSAIRHSPVFTVLPPNIHCKQCIHHDLQILESGHIVDTSVNDYDLGIPSSFICCYSFSKCLMNLKTALSSSYVFGKN